MAGSKWTGFFAFLLGTSLGVVAGILLTPKSGEELREDLSDRLNDGARRVRAAGRTVRRSVHDMADQAQQSVSDAADAALRASRKGSRS